MAAWRTAGSECSVSSARERVMGFILFIVLWFLYITVAKLWCILPGEDVKMTLLMEIHYTFMKKHVNPRESAKSARDGFAESVREV